MKIFGFDQQKIFILLLISNESSADGKKRKKLQICKIEKVIFVLFCFFVNERKLSRDSGV